MRILMAGSGGREAAFAKRLSEDAELYAVVSHENPTITECAESSGGGYVVGDPADPETVARFAAEHSVDYAFINADEPLANGVVDLLLERGIRAVGGTREAARIEWDKIYSVELMGRVCPRFTPFFVVVGDAGGIESAVSEFRARGLGIAVKPQGLTGGKGVKVMPEHLPGYDDCAAYAAELLKKNPGQGVLLVERLEGIEFTIMGITDGRTLVLSPASYDYPFRFEGDRGPGTGGMGCFTDSGERLPFMTDADLEDCRGIMQSVIDDMRGRGLRFQGVLNGGFFKTGDGIKFMEFNSRFGDPEGINILCTLEGSFSGMVASMWDGTLSEGAVRFQKKASVVKYMVAGEYPEASSEPTIFEVDVPAISGMGVGTFFASCVSAGGGRYETLKRSRVVAFAAVSDGIEDASRLVDAAISRHVRGGLEYRRDIGSREDLEKLGRTAEGLG